MGMVAEPRTESSADNHSEWTACESDEGTYGTANRGTGLSNLVFLLVGHRGPL
jgi:hypothetical protein